MGRGLEPHITIVSLFVVDVAKLVFSAQICIAFGSYFEFFLRLALLLNVLSISGSYINQVESN